ncbi:MAG: DMT family transporter [Pseudomonadota bacterium]
MSGNALGAALMVASMACFTLNDAMLKLTAGAVPLFQLLVVRGVITTGLILGARGRLGAIHANIRRRDWVLIILRSLTEVLIAYYFLTALFRMPLANLTAILQVVPLAVTLASALFLRERVGWRRILAILIGFFGVLLIIRPGADGFNIWSLYALVAVLGVTARDLLTRQLSADVPAMTVTLVTALTVTLAAGLASLSTSWVPIAPLTGVLIALSAMSILGGYYFSIQVMRVGDVSFVAPFRYTGLVWALLLGWFIFGEWPDPTTQIGALIVVGMGVFTFYREHQSRV